MVGESNFNLPTFSRIKSISKYTLDPELQGTVFFMTQHGLVFKELFDDVIQRGKKTLKYQPFKMVKVRCRIFSSSIVGIKLARLFSLKLRKGKLIESR